MNIYDALNKTNARLTFGDKWLCVDNDIWTVYQRKPYAKRTLILYTGADESIAVKCLVTDEGE